MRDSTKNPHHDVSRDPAILRSLGEARAARSLLTNAKCEGPVKWSGYRSRPEVTSRLPNEAFDSSAKQHFSYPGRLSGSVHVVLGQRSTARRSPRAGHSPSALSQSAWDEAWHFR